MNTSQINLPPSGRRRGRYTNEFKQKLVEACLAPGVSTASIALANCINANLLRRWVSESSNPHPSSVDYSEASVESVANRFPGFVRLDSSSEPIQHPKASGSSHGNVELEIELHHRDTRIHVRGSVAHCASFVRSVLQ